MSNYGANNVPKSESEYPSGNLLNIYTAALRTSIAIALAAVCL